MQKCNIIIGRFQPITKGHMRCADQSFAETGNKTVLCMIKTPENKRDSRHPFASSYLIELYKELFVGSSNIIDIIDEVKNADIVKAAEHLKSEGYIIGSWSCGTDRVTAYKKVAEKYAEQAGLPDDFKVIEIKRTDEDESATAARQALINDDRKGFYKLFPQVHMSSYLQKDLFNELRHQILNVVKK